MVKPSETGNPHELHARLPGRRPGGRKPAPRRRRACTALKSNAAILSPAPRPTDQACTQQYGGPQQATVTGVVDGKPVEANFSLTDGCEIAAWNAAKDVLGSAAELSKLQHLPRKTGCRAEAAHQARVRRYADPYLARRSAGSKHPVEDFLFTYYTQKPGQLMRWHPGAGVVLSGPDAAERAGWKYYRTPDAGELAAAGLPAGHRRRHGRRRNASWPTAGSALEFAGHHPGRHGRAAGPVRLLRAARMGHGVPAGQVRAPARIPAAAARRRPAPTRWWRRTGSAARTLTPSGSTLRTPCR